MATTKKVFWSLVSSQSGPPLGLEVAPQDAGPKPCLSGAVSAGKQSPAKASDLSLRKVEPKLGCSVGWSIIPYTKRLWV